MTVMRFKDTAGGRDKQVSADDPLPVSATISAEGIATTAKQDEQTTELVALNAKIAAAQASTDPVGVTVPGRICDLTFSTDTTAYASGDVIADFQEVADAVIENDALGTVMSLSFIDKANQKAALYLILARANNSLGTENAAPSLSDANSVNIEAVIPIATTDYVSASTGFAMVSIGAIGKKFRPATGTRIIYAALLNGTGTPTYGASDLVMHLGIDD